MVITTAVLGQAAVETSVALQVWIYYKFKDHFSN